MGKKFGYLEFDYMFENDILSHVRRNVDGSYEVQDFTEVSFLKPFRGKPQGDITDEDLMKFFKRRCLPETRANLREALESIGLVGYDPFNIVRKTYGLIYGDCMWIRFGGVKKTYEEVKKEMGL